MSFSKTANALLADASVTPSEWARLHDDRATVRLPKSRMKTAALTDLSNRKYLLSHCTIIASVMTEEDPHDHFIKPECSYLVNSNEDGWSNEVLEMSAPTFVGAYNFYEHYQNSKAAKGKIFDVVLRKVNITPDIWVYFGDILVGTDLENEELVTKIKDGDLDSMSMGCIADSVVCSFCGRVVNDDVPPCFHLSFQKGRFLTDDEGIPRRVAELCGHKSLPGGGVRFVEASWVKVPAFPGAKRRNILADEWSAPAELLKNASISESKGGLKKVAFSQGRHDLIVDYPATADLRSRLR